MAGYTSTTLEHLLILSVSRSYGTSHARTSRRTVSTKSDQANNVCPPVDAPAPAAAPTALLVTTDARNAGPADLDPSTPRLLTLATSFDPSIKASGRPLFTGTWWGVAFERTRLCVVCCLRNGDLVMEEIRCHGKLLSRKIEGFKRPSAGVACIQDVIGRPCIPVDRDTQKIYTRARTG
jgi:hypothetical protein